jgi:hypothetical protein
MKRVKRFLIGSLFLGVFGGVALADDQPADPAAGAAADANMGAPPVAAAVTAARWPRAVIDRPLTLPSALPLVGADFLVSKLTATVGTTTVSSTATLLDAAVGFGVTDDFELNTLTPTYAVRTSPEGRAKGPLDLGIGYKLLRGAMDGKLEVIARAVIGYDLEASTVRPLRLGVQVQYNATPAVAILSHDLGTGNAGISIALDATPKPIYLTLPIGIGFQATPELWIEADTLLFQSIKISNAPNVSIADATPLLLTGILNTLDRHLDLLGYAGFYDLQHAGDSFSFGVGFRYYPGKV